MRFYSYLKYMQVYKTCQYFSSCSVATRQLSSLMSQCKVRAVSLRLLSHLHIITNSSQTLQDQAVKMQTSNERS